MKFLEKLDNIFSLKEELEFEFFDNDIENKIINEINRSTKSILVVMAYFTSEKIFYALLKKKRAGVRVIVVIDRNDNNENVDFDIDLLGTIYKIDIKTSKYDNLMHNKYCIIDKKVVIDGSYNWTKSSNYNLEHIIIIRNKKIAHKYINSFKKIKNL